MTPEEICLIAEQNYRPMKLAGDWDGVSAKAMLSEKKGPGLEPENKPRSGKGVNRTGPRFQPPKAGQPEWRVFHGKVMYWCNICGYWNLTHFTKEKEGVNVEGYLENATVNGHQRGIGKHSKRSKEDKKELEAVTPTATIASVPRPGVSWAAALINRE
eukprot:11078374-Ditylum_brightwellii.AAC.1